MTTSSTNVKPSTEEPARLSGGGWTQRCSETAGKHRCSLPDLQETSTVWASQASCCVCRSQHLRFVGPGISPRRQQSFHGFHHVAGRPPEAVHQLLVREKPQTQERGGEDGPQEQLQPQEEHQQEEKSPLQQPEGAGLVAQSLPGRAEERAVKLGLRLCFVLLVKSLGPLDHVPLVQGNGSKLCWPRRTQRRWSGRPTSGVTTVCRGYAATRSTTHLQLLVAVIDFTVFGNRPHLPGNGPRPRTIPSSGPSKASVWRGWWEAATDLRPPPRPSLPEIRVKSCETWRQGQSGASRFWSLDGAADVVPNCWTTARENLSPPFVVHSLAVWILWNVKSKECIQQSGVVIHSI